MSSVFLERPDLFKSTFIRPTAHRLGQAVLENGQIASTRDRYEPNIGVVVRTKNDSLGLTRILDNITHLSTSYEGRIDVAIVDTESKDKTLDYAKDFGAAIINLTQAEFTYPLSLNAGLEALADDVEATFLTVGHAQPSLPNTISAAAQHFIRPNVTGVYGRTLPHETASLTEKLFSPSSIGETKEIDQLQMGVLGATNAMIRNATWQARPFDESYQAGGEDSAWAKKALERGELIVYEPAASVHHSHGLNAINSINQWIHWNDVLSGPALFDYAAYIKRRPDMK